MSKRLPNKSFFAEGLWNTSQIYVPLQIYQETNSVDFMAFLTTLKNTHPFQRNFFTIIESPVYVSKTSPKDGLFLQKGDTLNCQ